MAAKTEDKKSNSNIINFNNFKKKKTLQYAVSFFNIYF